MAEPRTPEGARAGGEAIESKAPARPATEGVTLTPEELKLREELGEVITQLIFTTQEMAFEMAMMECPKRTTCPLVAKAKDVVRQVRQLFEIQRKLTRLGRGRAGGTATPAV